MNIFTALVQSITNAAKAIGTASKAVPVSIMKMLLLLINAVRFLVDFAIEMLSSVGKLLLRGYLSFEASAVSSAQKIVEWLIMLRWGAVLAFALYLIYSFFGIDVLLVVMFIFCIAIWRNYKNVKQEEEKIHDLISRINKFLAPYFKWSVRIVAIFLSLYGSYETCLMFQQHISRRESTREANAEERVEENHKKESTPLAGTIDGNGYAEQREQMTEEIEHQSNAVKEHRQLAEELNNQLYIKSDLARMADRSEKAAEERSEPDPEPAEVTTQADQKKQRSTASTQTKPSYEGQIREIRVPEERIIRVSPKSAAPQIEEVDVTEDVPVYTAPPPSTAGADARQTVRSQNATKFCVP